MGQKTRVGRTNAKSSNFEKESSGAGRGSDSQMENWGGESSPPPLKGVSPEGQSQGPQPAAPKTNTEKAGA